MSTPTVVTSRPLGTEVCSRAAAQYIHHVKGEGKYLRFDGDLADKLLSEETLSDETLAEVARCADSDYDYEDASENFWNAWGSGYPLCKKMGDLIRAQCDVETPREDHEVYYCDTVVNTYGDTGRAHGHCD